MTHDPKINHANKDINTDLTKYNVHEFIANPDKILNKHYGDYVKQHDDRVKRKDRKYGSVKQYLDKQKGHPDVTIVNTFGSKDTLAKFEADLYIAYTRHQKHHTNLDRVNFKRLLLATYVLGLQKSAHGFNKRNPNITLVEDNIHVDESGAPHMHSRDIPRGYTRTGTPSERFTRALIAQYGTDEEQHSKVERGKEYMRKWREQEDKATVRCMNEAFKEKFPELGVKFELTRTGVALNLPMESYKQHADEVVTLKQSTADLKDEHKQLQSSVDHEQQRFNELKQANEELEEMRRINELKRKQDELKRKKELEKRKVENEKLKQKHDYLEHEKHKVLAGYKKLYTVIANWYSDLGANYKYNGKNVNYKVASGKMTVKKRNEQQSGIKLLGTLIREHATERALQRMGISPLSPANKSVSHTHQREREGPDGPTMG